MLYAIKGGMLSVIVDLLSNLPGWSISILSFIILYVLVNAIFIIKSFINRINSRIKSSKYTG